jgi:hypothetical protein
LGGTAIYEFAKWFYGRLYKINDSTEYRMINGSQDALRSDDGSAVPANRVKRTFGSNETWYSQTYDYEISSATFVTPPVFTVNW